MYYGMDHMQLSSTYLNAIEAVYGLLGEQNEVAGQRKKGSKYGE